jgi:hypothetical protein
VLLPTHCIYKKGTFRQVYTSEMYFLFPDCVDCANETIYVEDFIRHANWDTHSERFTADLTVAVLKQELEVTPICLNKDAISEGILIERVEGDSVKESKQSVVPFEVCKETDAKDLVWERSFCTKNEENHGNFSLENLAGKSTKNLLFHFRRVFVNIPIE